jgi:hypothetical protein
MDIKRLLLLGFPLPLEKATSTDATMTTRALATNRAKSSTEATMTLRDFAIRPLER